MCNPTEMEKAPMEYIPMQSVVGAELILDFFLRAPPPRRKDRGNEMVFGFCICWREEGGSLGGLF